MLFNRIKHPHLKSNEGSLGDSKSRPGMLRPGHQPYRHRKGNLPSLNKKQWKEISAGKPKTPEQAQSHKCAEGKQVDSQIWEVHLPADLQLPEGTGWGKSKCPSPRKSSVSRKEWSKGAGKLSFTSHVKSAVALHHPEPMKSLYSFLRARGTINTCELNGSSSENWPTVRGPLVEPWVSEFSDQQYQHHLGTCCCCCC